MEAGQFRVALERSPPFFGLEFHRRLISMKNLAHLVTDQVPIKSSLQIGQVSPKDVFMGER